jgi:hypothetical protein
MTIVDPRQTARLGLFEQYRAQSRTSWVDATGGSMSPAVPPGSRLLVEFGRTTDAIGELVVFRRRDALIAHRLVARTRTAYGVRLLAKGDAEAYLDPPIDAADVLGVARRVRLPDGREFDVRPATTSARVVAGVSWWSGRVAGGGTRLLRRLPASWLVQRAALGGWLRLSRVPTRVISQALPRHARGTRGGRR